MNLSYGLAWIFPLMFAPNHYTFLKKPKWLEGGELEIRITVIPNYELKTVILPFGEKVKVD